MTLLTSSIFSKWLTLKKKTHLTIKIGCYLSNKRE
jgi:hypothetical protein